jgi:hypothetical protein
MSFANPSVSLQTTFVNSVDAPSLALLVPIVHRGLRERSAETKKKAAQIVGNMSSLVSEHKDMLPYLSLLLPEVQKVGLIWHQHWANRKSLEDFSQVLCCAYFEPHLLIVQFLFE